MIDLRKIAIWPEGGGAAPVPPGPGPVPTDGKTRIFFFSQAGAQVTLNYVQLSANSVEVDWGDGSATERSESLNAALTHTFQDSAEHIITLDSEEEYSLRQTSPVMSYGVFKENAAAVNLSDIIFGAKVKEIQGVSRYPGLKSVSMADGADRNLPAQAFFGCSILENVELKDVATIGSQAFYNCYALRNLIIHEGLTEIPSMCFYGCSSLHSITLPESIENIASQAFYNSGIEELVFPNRVTAIGDYACYLCSNLRRVEIPASVTSIGSLAFQTSALMDVIVRATIPPTLGTNVFLTTLTEQKIYVPAEAVDTYKAATNWSAYADRIFPIPNN